MNESQAKQILVITAADDARAAKMKFRRLIGKYHPDEEEFLLFLRSILHVCKGLLCFAEMGAYTFHDHRSQIKL